MSDAVRKYKMVQKIIKSSEKKPAYKRPNTISSILKNMKDMYGREEQTGVYEIPLINNDKQQKEVYIRVIARNLRERLKEHKADIRKGVLMTALARRAYKFDIKVE